MLLLLIWAVELFLYSIHLIEYYRPLNFKSVFFLIGVVIIVLFAGVVSKPKRRHLYVPIQKSTIAYATVEIEEKANKVTKYFIYGTILNVIYSKGFPLLWLFTGGGNYTEFGIPTFNGFMNALYYIAIVLNMYLYLSTNDRKYSKSLLLLVLYPVFCMTRALIFTMGFELIGLYIMMRKIKAKTITILVGCALAIIILFGVIGNQRNGGAVSEATEAMVRELVDSKHVDTMTKLPSGFTWVYWYFTCSTNNLIFNIEKLHPNYLPDNTLKRLLPSVLRGLLFEEKEYEDSYVFEMDNTIVNTFTLYATYLTDFGVPMTMFLFFFVGWFFYKVYYRALAGRLNYFLMYPAIIMVICLSVFDDFMLSLPTIFQLVITYYMFKPKHRIVKYGQPDIIKQAVC